jgi:hypothetical protein
LAFGITGVILYLGCIVVMVIAGRQGSVEFFNNLFHGINTASIIRINVPAREAVIGLIETFILFFLIGACIAGVYNYLNREQA